LTFYHGHTSIAYIIKNPVIAGPGEKMLSIDQVADHILMADPTGGLANRDLQKLLYYVQGFYLAKTGEPLFRESLNAWKFGPVNSGIFHRFRDLGYISIPKPTRPLVELDQTAAAVLTAVVMAFAPLGQGKLIEYSHADQPWAREYIPDRNQPLTHETLRNYFQSFESMEEYLQLAQQKYNFHTLIVQRNQYLGTLPSIGTEWISGGGASPSTQACKLAKDFLYHLERFVFASAPKPEIPKLVLGPLPAGGVSIELSTNRTTLYVNLWNTERVEIDVENEDGEFASEEVTFAEFEEDFSAYYRKLVA
jgi:uncharacterized phage-associated protein